VQTKNKNKTKQKTHILLPVAIETVRSWSQQAIELAQEIRRRTTVITEDSRETTFLFQRLSVALQRKNVVSFLNPFLSH